MMEFLQDLQEARMTRDANNRKSLTFTDCCERLYLTLLILEVLRLSPAYKNIVQKYTSKTTQYSNYNKFKVDATDLYNFIYYVTGDDQAIDKLKDPAAARRLRQYVHLPTMQLNGYLHKISTGSDTTSGSEIVIKVESALKITNSDYKIIRRNILNFSKLNNVQRGQTITKLLYAARAKLRSSDIIEHLEKFAQQGDFENSNVVDTEPNISVPDIVVDDATINNYKYLVGTSKLMMAKQFINFAKKGTAVSSTMVAAYLPVIKMVTEIVQAGPGYIQQLKVLHQRAKKHLKD